VGDRRVPLDVVDAVIDGDAVDWTRAAARADAATRPALDALRSLARAARPADRVESERARDAADRGDRGWMHAIAALAAFQVLAGAAGYISGADIPTPVPATGALLLMAAFGVAAAWLFVGGRDARARTLGGYFLLVASAFARRFLMAFPLGTAGVLTRGLFPDAFLPVFLWSFAGRFPRVLRFSAAERFCDAARRVSVFAGAVLFVVNAAVAHGLDAPAALLLYRAHPRGAYWAIVLGLSAIAVPVIAIRTRGAQREERRRVALFGTVLAATIGPVLLEILAEVLFPRFKRLMDVAPIRRATIAPFFGLLLSVPFLTAYAVIVDRVLDVRVAVGRALQYMFARATLVAVPVVPFAAVLAYGYKHQDVSLGQLFSGSRGFLVAALTMTGVVLWTLRPRALAAINRTFFRTSLDANRDLGALASELRAARSATEIAELVERAIQRTVGATAATVFLRDGTGGRFVPVRGAACGLAADAACAALLQVGATSLVVGSDQPSSIFALLPAAERAWVEQAGYAVLVPLSGSQDEPLGFVATGAKRGGLAFPHDELSFLAAVASAAALGFEARRVQASSAAHGEDEPASECPACGAMDATHADRCACGAERRTAALPLLLQGRFQVERRLGAGGMGVVYRGRDVALDRGVALKTLSRLSAVAADRLAHEARVMASVVHPNLATIFGVERWRSTPILVVELLEGGTLAARLEKGALPIDQVLRIGLLLAPALEQLHEAGVLHRDVKPSNIAFTISGVPKLLDFGLASFTAAPAGDFAGDLTAPTATQTLALAGRPLAGTPLYLSPDALRGAEPDATFDVWALSLALYEAIAGRHPFAAATVPDVLSKIREGHVPDLRRSRADCPEAVAATFASLLSGNPRDRPRTASQLRDRLDDLARSS